MKKTMTIVLALLMLTAYLSHAQVFSGNDYQTNNNSLLWEISGKDIKTPSYLYGTFHLMCEEDIHFSGNFNKAMNASSSIYFEINLDDPGTAFETMKNLFMKDDTRLSQLFDSSQYQKLKNFFKDSLHMSMAMIDKMKPAFSSSLLYPYMMHCQTTAGVETEVMKKAKALNKKIFGFETIAFQSSVFDKIPYKDQAAELLNMIDSMDKYKADFSRMLAMYQSQQLNEIEKSFDNDPGFEKEKDDLLNNRNLDWAKQLKSILPQSNIFIAVGAGHLPGENGLIQLLKNLGYTVKPLVNL